MLRPSPGRVLIKRLDAPKPSSSLIVTPETVRDKPSQFGLVLAIGKLKNGGFNVGDTVILSDFAGAPCDVTIDDMQIEGAVVMEEDILAVVEGM